ncbi:hypothetical protein JZ751_021844 [Albula glossodonta]|uniref:Uncharacterized protein n=1 Tax=Albula glossodonta TaxID=121402 RepID=A0A8T2N2R7_9TELE|nr:hypothetical protein JZ751_021844 [Albula glossodonta]
MREPIRIQHALWIGNRVVFTALCWGVGEQQHHDRMEWNVVWCCCAVNPGGLLGDDAIPHMSSRRTITQVSSLCLSVSVSVSSEELADSRKIARPVKGGGYFSGNKTASPCLSILCALEDYLVSFLPPLFQKGRNQNPGSSAGVLLSSKRKIHRCILPCSSTNVVKPPDHLRLTGRAEARETLVPCREIGVTLYLNILSSKVSMRSPVFIKSNREKLTFEWSQNQKGLQNSKARVIYLCCLLRIGKETVTHCVGAALGVLLQHVAHMLRLSYACDVASQTHRGKRERKRSTA